jgi:disulfide bond formation protein DsbB
VENTEVEMKDNVVLFAIGLVGALYAMVSSEMKEVVVAALPVASALPPLSNALPPALVSAYASVKIARIRAETKKAQQPLPPQASCLDTLLWAMLIFLLLVIALVVGAIAAVAYVGGNF